tara:strand:- start:1045 stop:1494 length:450 start_codon:yes stop_codon:yes gene_type:complete
MKQFIKGILLLFIALFSTLIISILSIVISLAYYLFSFNWQLGLSKFGEYAHKMALSIDQFANVSVQNLLNWLLIRKGNVNFYSFGDEDDTVSYVISMNEGMLSLSKFGKFWAWFLDFVDKDHLKKTIKNKQKSDLEAWNRIEESKKQAK